MSDEALGAPLAVELPEGPPPVIRRSRSARVGLRVGLLAIVGVAAAGLATMAGSDNGASSPEAAVRQFFEAAANEDILAAARLVSPAEIGSAPELYDLIIDVMKREGALGPKGKPLAGVDLRVDGLKLQTTQLAPDVGKVAVVAGTLGVRVNAADMDEKIRATMSEPTDIAESMTVAEINEQIASSWRSSDIDGATGEISGLFVMTVEIDGRWYLSYQYTMFEYFREAFGAPVPDFANRIAGPGVAKPEDLVTVLVDELERFDGPALAATMSTTGQARTGYGFVLPSETQAIADYLPVLQLAIERLTGSLNASTADVRSRFAEQLRRFDISITADAESEAKPLTKNQSIVTLTSLDLTVKFKGEFEGERIEGVVSLRVRGTCVRWSYEGGISSRPVDSTSGEECEALEAAGIPGLFFVAAKSGDGWYFSGIETVVQYVRLALESQR
jgi:hypothetical protein